MFDGKTCLVTGGTGSWGQELVRRLLQFNPREIRVFSRNEYAQVQMQTVFPADDALRFIIGDVRDYTAVYDACKGVDYVFHLAALKHVPVCEKQPEEALKTNVVGTQNVIRASIATGVKKVVDVSTDKAVSPVNFYGTTKALGEQLMIQANQLSDATRFVCIRGGNVLGTNGSVVPLFKKQILERSEVTITSKEMTRFFLTLSDAIQLLLEAATVAIGGETFVMKMKMCRILQLAQVMGQALASTRVDIREIGVRSGEKTHEVLVSTYESPTTFQYGLRYYVVLPANAPSTLLNAYSHLPKAQFESYTSDSDLMKDAEIEEMLRTGGFIP